MTRFEFLVGVRTRSMRESSGIENARFSLYRDDTRPNWSTQQSVFCFNAVQKNAERFGVQQTGREATVVSEV